MIPTNRMRRLEHVGIATRDARTTAAVFETILGRSPYAVEIVEREGVRTTFIPAGQVKLELLEALDADSALGRYLDQHGPGLHHLAFEVDDLDAAHARLEDAGLRLLGQPASGADEKRIFFIHPKDAAGILVELCQAVPGVATALNGEGPANAPACLVTASTDEWGTIRAMTRRFRVWYSPDGGTPDGIPDDCHVVSFDDTVHPSPDVVVDPETLPGNRQDLLVIFRGDEDGETGSRATVRLPRHLLARLPDPDSTLADLIAAHLLA